METFRPRSATWQRVEVDDGNVLGVPARRTHQFELQSVRRTPSPTAASARSISLPYAAIIRSSWRGRLSLCSLR